MMSMARIPITAGDRSAPKSRATGSFPGSASSGRDGSSALPEPFSSLPASPGGCCGRRSSDRIPAAPGDCEPKPPEWSPSALRLAPRHRARRRRGPAPSCDPRHRAVRLSTWPAASDPIPSAAGVLLMPTPTPSISPLPSPTGDRIPVPTVGESSQRSAVSTPSAPTAGADAGAPVDINAAGVAELETLPGMVWRTPRRPSSTIVSNTDRTRSTPRAGHGPAKIDVIPVTSSRREPLPYSNSRPRMSLSQRGRPTTVDPHPDGQPAVPPARSRRRTPSGSALDTATRSATGTTAPRRWRSAPSGRKNSQRTGTPMANSPGRGANAEDQPGPAARPSEAAPARPRPPSRRAGRGRERSPTGGSSSGRERAFVDRVAYAPPPLGRATSTSRAVHVAGGPSGEGIVGCRHPSSSSSALAGLLLVNQPSPFSSPSSSAEGAPRRSPAEVLVLAVALIVVPRGGGG